MGVNLVGLHLGMKVIPTHLKKAEMILLDCRAKRDWG